MWKKYGGYVILQIQGLGLGRFLRRLLFSGIPVFDIRRTDETTATLRIYAADFARLLPIRRRERCRIRMLRKYGMAFRLRAFLQRPALLVGIPLSFILLWSLCARIWLIRVEGTQRVSEDEVLSLLAEHGLSVGKRPKGNVLIMSPWNYPFLLTLSPVIAALAAGNTVMVKPSAYAPATSEVIADMLSQTFDEEYVACITGGRAENQELLSLKFDHIFFTGSQNVGKEVLRKAAEHLTPVTLELVEMVGLRLTISASIRKLIIPMQP